MKLWETEIMAIKPSTGELTRFMGPHVPGINIKDAIDYCENNGLGYCRVTGGILVAEIPCKEGTHDPDYNKLIDYENTRNN